MADENSAADQAPESVTPAAVNGQDAAPENSNLDTPHKDVVMTDAAVDQAVRTSPIDLFGKSD